MHIVQNYKGRVPLPSPFPGPKGESQELVMEVGLVLALALGLALGQEVRVEEGLLAEDYEDYDYYYQLEDFQAVAHHPQLTHRYDVPGYSDLQCEGERQVINILSVKFGHSRQDLDVNHCVTDFTKHYRESLCKASSCRSASPLL